MTLMGASILADPAVGRTLTIRGTAYPVLLPKVRDPRLRLAAVITSLQVLGQTAFGFQLSIAQILVALATCAILEFGITFRQRRVIMWPASALLTGNGVAFVLRVPGTEHGDWWSMNGWWIFAGTAAVALLSKHLIRFRGHHFLNPSNFGLVVCFVLLGSTRADPLALWWGPMSLWMVLALGIIVVGVFTILLRLHLLAIAVTFWVTFAVGIGVIAAAGHEMTARWHLGPITGFEFWRVLVFSPEVLIFLFFMITDPKTSPSGIRQRRVYAVAIGLLAVLLIAPHDDGVLDEGRAARRADARVRFAPGDRVARAALRADVHRSAAARSRRPGGRRLRCVRWATRSRRPSRASERGVREPGCHGSAAARNDSSLERGRNAARRRSRSRGHG